MAHKKPPLSLRRPAEAVDPLQAERFVRGAAARPVEPPAPPAAQVPRRPDAQTSERLEAAPPTGPSKALVYRKRTDDHRRRMTIYLPEDLSRRLRLYAAEHDQDYSVVLAEALGGLLDRKGVR